VPAHPNRKQAQAHRQHLRRSKKPKGFDGCPVSPVVFEVLTDCRRHLDFSFQIISADRRDGVAQRFGHSSQKQLWDAYQAGHGNPANPPLTSTHEYKNGGTNPRYPNVSGSPAYHTKFRTGATLPSWALGLDFASNDQATAFIGHARDLGYHFFQPYQSGSELHHLCLADNPLPNLIKRNRA
jgi:hypothetical protein